jgi:hypothetical protein
VKSTFILKETPERSSSIHSILSVALFDRSESVWGLALEYATLSMTITPASTMFGKNIGRIIEKKIEK